MAQNTSKVASPRLIGIAGGTGSGKTTLATLLHTIGPSTNTDVKLLALDSYYKTGDHLTLSERATRNYDHPDSLDFDLLQNDLQTLLAGDSIRIPIYDFATHTRAGFEAPLPPPEVLVIEGILALHPSWLRNILSLKVFVDTPEQQRFERRLCRDVKERGRTAESVHAQWTATVKPMHEEYCEVTRRYADILVEGTVDLSALAHSILMRR